MSVPSSTASPRSDQGSDEEAFAFDGRKGTSSGAGAAGMRPDPDLTVSSWADRHRKLASRASAEPGQYRTARTPYMREIMDRLSPGDPTQRIVFMKAAQVGATEGATTGSAS
jgi:phage terminase large subunit GpA-like protein